MVEEDRKSGDQFSRIDQLSLAGHFEAMFCRASLRCGLLFAVFHAVGSLTGHAAEQPRPLRREEPPYLKRLLETTEDVRATVTFDVDARGYVVNAKIVHASDQQFGEIARKTIGRWIFEPAMRNGKAVATGELTQDFVFPAAPAEKLSFIIGRPAFVDLVGGTVAVSDLSETPTLIAPPFGEPPAELSKEIPTANVTLGFVIGMDGLPVNPVVEAASAERLGIYGMLAILRARWKPVLIDGAPVNVRARITLDLNAPIPGSENIGLKPVNIREQISLPIHRVLPVFSDEVRKKKLRGIVEVDFVVGPTGFVTNPKIAWSPHPEFEGPAIEAILQWRFRPGIADGKPVAVRVRQSFTIDLGKR